MLFILSFMLFLCVLPLPCSLNVAKLPNCANKNENQGWVFVNTLDGKLTVLDYNNHGKEVWSIDTGPGPMLSSNIDRIELTNNGNWVRIIPALSGSLYKFNGRTIDAIPISADSLLSASFRYLDDLVIAGGKELRTYGVMLNSGKLLYECSLDGCKNKTNYETYEDLIILERNTKTVRAVEPRSGLERWNFSVGQLNLQFPQSSCHSANSDIHLEFYMKAVVPEGLVYALGPFNEITWKKQFSSPIVNVWTWNGHTLNSVNLFSDKQYSWGSTSNSVSPIIYIGMHKKQLYIHESVILQKLLAFGTNNKPNQLTEIASDSQIPWKPFPAKSSALAIVDNDLANQSEDLGPNQISTTALSVLYASEYVNGNGYYLYTSEDIEQQNNIKCDNNNTIDTEDENFSEEEEDDGEEEEETPVQVIIVSLWYWWKEVVIIAIGTSFALNLINQQVITRFRLRNESSNSNQSINTNSSDTSPTLPVYVKRISESSDKEFVSRYLTDFDLINCLGKGGFGVVFEARNKIDECSYAVKRITLPNKPESRQRVMREVKALAKLDHRNIVRYFNAWLESPPPEWIDEFDQVWHHDTLTDGLEFSTTKSRQIKYNKLESSVVINFSSQSDINSSKSLNSNSLKLPKSNNDDDDSFIVFENSDTNKTDDVSKASTTTNSSLSMVKCDKPESPNKGSRSHPTVYAPEKVFLYIQMQLCRRESLRDWLKDNVQRNHQEIKSIFEQIVSAVEYVHLKGLIHRDLKPSNIFFSIEGEVKIGDFGLVTGMEEVSGDITPVEQNSSFSEKHTQAVGTQLYMSPEQLSGLSYNYKVDIYSLGVILFELLVPFQTVMERNITLSDLRRNKFPEKFCQAFQKEYQLLILMLSECPEKRPTTFGIRARPPLSDSNNVCDDYLSSCHQDTNFIINKSKIPLVFRFKRERFFCFNLYLDLNYCNF